jgi:glycosyltransferase involved in cell wall biosynthesis
MARPDLSRFDASTRASAELEYVLRDTKKTDSVHQISVDRALKQPRVVQEKVKRTITRILFISQDASLLNPEMQSLDGFLNLSELFDEVHILILRQGIEAKNPVLRVASNVWIYTATSRLWSGMLHQGIKTAEDQLVFATGFRPDLIVARDPHESAFVAHRLAKKFNVKAQVHILENFFHRDFAKKYHHYRLKRLLASFLIKRFTSVRTSSDSLRNYFSKKYHILDIETLPQFNDYESIMQAPVTLDLKDTYKPFVFMMLYVGSLSHQSTFFRAIDAARFALKNPRVGMLVLGSGAAKDEFVKRAKILGVEKQIVFESKVTDIVPYLKAAQLLVVTDTDAFSDELSLKAAAAGIPLVAAKTEQRLELFEDNVSAYLCDETDTQLFADRINQLLNSVAERKVLAERARLMILENFHHDKEFYQELYRNSIERALVVETKPADAD